MEIKAKENVGALYVEGKPDDVFWLGLPWRALTFSFCDAGTPLEKGSVRFAWNEQGLYIHAELEDSVVVSTDRRDEQLHFELGDVFEFFIKPRNRDYYWELYATPYGNKSTLFFPEERDGMTVDNFLNDHQYHGLQVKSEMTSDGWKADLFVPAEELEALGDDWGGETQWTVLCGRYNYNNTALEEPELSMWPPVSAVNFHLTQEYADLVLINSK